MQNEWDDNMLLDLLPVEEDAELLRLLPATTIPLNEPAQLPSRAKRRRPSATVIKARIGSGDELLLLRDEVATLSGNLEAIQMQRSLVHGTTAATAQEAMMVQRRKRTRAEEINLQLRQAVYRQSHFLKKLRTAFSSGVANGLDLDMVQLVHKYTHLRADATSRRADYRAMFSSSQLVMSADIVRRETASVVASKRHPFVNTQFLRTPSGVGWTASCVFAFDTLDVAQVLRAACSVTWENERWWPKCKPTAYSREIVDDASHAKVEARQNQCYVISKVQLATVRQQQQQQHELQMEIRSMMNYSLEEDQAQLTVDFVDEDDLHPFDKDTDFYRKSAGCSVFGRERCDDGELRVVCRVICTKLFAHGTNAASVAVGRRFFAFAEAAARDCGMVMHDRMVKQMADEDELTSQAEALCETT